jgi:hypothetical protein
MIQRKSSLNLVLTDGCQMGVSDKGSTIRSDALHGYDVGVFPDKLAANRDMLAAPPWLCEAIRALSLCPPGSAKGRAEVRNPWRRYR